MTDSRLDQDSESVSISLLADRKSRRILDIEAAGNDGVAVKASAEVVDVLLGRGGNVDEICPLEVVYTPPYASAMDVVNLAALHLIMFYQVQAVP